MTKEVFQEIYKDLKHNGELISPRGISVKEIENYSYVLPPYVRFQSFKERKLNLNYIKSEILWYLKGERFDTSIEEKARLWSSIKNSDGSINSNYGQYIFHESCCQFDNVVEILKSDRDSRRASIVILDSQHLFSDTDDVPCTYSLNFRIRNNKLNMSVHMRSQDAIYGMGNDAPAFSVIHEMLFVVLNEYYGNLELGEYHHTVDSFHVYEKHFKMLDKLINSNNFQEIDCPKISGAKEVDFLRKLNFKNIPKSFKFTRWLLDNE